VESSLVLQQAQAELAAARSQAAEAQQQLAEVAGREREAAQQLRQLSSTLAAVHAEHDGATATLRQQHQQEVEAATAEALAAAQQVQRERDGLQRRLAEVEAEFRCALQVLLSGWSLSCVALQRACNKGWVPRYARTVPGPANS